MYFIAKKPTPILNTPDFNSVFGAKTLPLDEQGLLRPLEMVAFPGTKFRHLEKINTHIARVSTNEYAGESLYIDTRFTKTCSADHPERKISLPSLSVVLSRLECALGLPYVWGGNWSPGVPELADLYNCEEGLLQGLDCSGLLYEATNGATPRNTSELLHFGRNVTDDVPQPLDICIWPGHLVIFFSKKIVIESIHPKGVIFTPFQERKQTLPTNALIKRFHN